MSDDLIQKPLYLSAADVDAMQTQESASSEPESKVDFANVSGELKDTLIDLGFTVSEPEPTPEPEPVVEAPAGYESVRAVQKALEVPESGQWDVPTQRAWTELLMAQKHIPTLHRNNLIRDWEEHAIEAGYDPTDEAQVEFIIQLKESADKETPELFQPILLNRPKPRPVQLTQKPAEKKPVRKRRRKTQKEN